MGKKPKNGSSKGRTPRKKRAPESLEDRILLSGTWVDADSGDPLADATDGDDVFTGTTGDDLARGMGGDDNLFGDAGNDTLFGDAGNDTLSGGAGDDTLDGGTGNDTIDGGEGNDTVSFSESSDRVVVDLDAGTASGQGDDTITNVENVVGSDSSDIIKGDAADNTISGGDGNDFIEGRAGDDTLDGGSGDDVIDAGAGNDTVAGGQGDDLLLGGSGTDTVDYSGSATGVNVDLADESATGEGNDTVIGFENVTGSAYDDTIEGDSGANTILGGEGSDTLRGNAGDDRLEGGAGNDTLEGGTGNDTLLGGADDDTLRGGEGDDTLEGGTGNDTLEGGAGNDTLRGGTGDDTLDGGAGDDLLVGGAGDDVITGGSGTDTVSYTDSGAGVNVNLETGTATGDGTDSISGVENVTGSAFADTITGDAGANTINGGAGNDVLSGGAGNDTIEGGAGDDVISGGAGADTLSGGEGDDLFLSDGADTIQGGAGTDTVSFAEAASGVTFDLAGTGVEQIIGSDHDDVFAVSAASNGDTFVIDGGGGYNVLDLSAFDISDITVDQDAGTVTVDLGGGESFTIEFTNVGHFMAGGVGGEPMLSTGGDIVVNESESVQITTTGFSSGTGELTYTWTQVSGPVVSIDGADTGQPSFDTPELDSNTTMRFRVEVSDGTTTGIEYVTVGITADNDPVVVDLGPDLNVTEGDAVTLSASVVDPEGYYTTQTWEQVSGPAVDLQGTDSLSPTFDAPELQESTDLVFKITVSDGETDVVEYVTVHVDATDDIAIADAGENFTAQESTTVQLTGTAIDSDGGDVTYSWRQISGPTVTLTDADTANATFDAPEGFVNTDFEFELTVSDGVNESVDTVVVTVNANDDRPQFTSLPTLSVGENEAVELSATATDPEGNGITYSWRQVGGAEVELSGTDTQNPTFESPESVVNSWLSFEVTASDGETTSVGTVEVLVNAVNDAATADAGGDYALESGAQGTLSATGEDPEGLALAYTWTQVGGPDVTITNPNAPDATFSAPGVTEATELTFQVEVTDGTNTSVDTITVTVNPTVGAGGGESGGGESGGGESGGGESGGGESGGGESGGGESGSGESGGGESGSGESGGGESGGGESGGGGTDPDPETSGPLTISAPAMLDAPEGDTITLGVNVSQSTGDVQYEWVQVAGTETLDLAGADSAEPSFVAPESTHNEIYSFDVTVTDDNGSETVRINVRLVADNDGPVVDADDAATQINESVYTVGSTASDPEGQTLSYRWVQTEGPSVRMLSTTSPELRFSTRGLDDTSNVTFELQVSDGTTVSTDLVSLVVDPGNTAPVVSAGPDQSVVEGDLVQLTSAASDADGDGLTYTWTQTGGPPVVLSDASDAAPTFTAPQSGGLEDVTFELTVSDGIEEVTDSVTVSVTGVNDPPEVDAGPFQSVDENDLVTLAATVNDADSENLTYTWRQTGGATVTLSSTDSASATFTAPEGVANSYVTFELEVSDGEYTVTDTVVVLVNADNDAPTLDAGPDFTVSEETTVTLTATAEDPEGRPLAHEWVQTGGPTVSLSDPYSLDPSFDAPNVANDTELTFQITTTDGVNTVIDTVTVTVAGENDAPEPTNATTLVTEDTQTSLLLTGTDPDIDQEITTYRIDSLPDVGTLTFNGAAVTAGDTFTAEQIASGDLSFTPPADYSGSTSIQFSVSDGDVWSDAPATQSIVIVGEADAPIITLADATGTEESPISLSVDIALADTDGSESIASVQASGAPPGSVFTDGVTSVTAWDGTADISALDLASLQIIPADNYDQDFTLTISATSVEADNGDTTTGAATMVVHIDAVNDTPTAVDGSVSINEDGVAVVSLGSQDVDTGDAAATFRIESLPTNGTLLLDGVAVTASDEISAYDVSHGRLTFEPDADWAGSTSFDFSVSDGELWSDADATFTINVSGVADAPIVTVSDAYGFEDSAIALDLSVAAADTDGSETISRIEISGAPAGSTFTDGVNTASAYGLPVDITGWDLTSLSITPAANYDIDFDLQIDVTATEPDSGHSTTTTESLTVHTTGQNDAPVVQAGTATIDEDGVATIRLAATELDTGDSVESMRIESLPDSGTLLLNGVEVTEGQVIDKALIDSGALTFEPDTDWSGTTSLRFSAFDGELWSATEGEYSVTVNAVADAATLTTSDASGLEDATIALDLSSALTDTDGSETLSITITGVPDGASLSAGTANPDGSWTLEPGQLDGLTITPASNSSSDFELTVTATTTEADGDTASTSSTVNVTVTGVADAPTLTTSDASGLEDAPIALDLSSTLTDTDGSETLSITVTGVPDGATLSAGTANPDGSWTLEPGQLDGLTITPPADSDADFELTVTATATEADGDTASTTSTLNVTVTGVADAPTLTISDAAGAEDSVIALDIASALSDTDGSETLTSITITGVPTGASLSAGTANPDGSWTLQPGQLDGLTITPASDSASDFELTVTATSTEADGDTASTTAVIDVTVTGVADTPTLSVEDASGLEDAAIALDLSSALTDTDGSESLSITITGVPDGASLSAGTANPDGSWTLQPGQLDGLTITPPANSDADFDLTVTATSAEADGDTASTTSTLNVTVTGVADAPTLTISDASGLEDAPIALDLSAALTDTDGSETLTDITITGVPDGASLSAGTANPDGSWTLEPGQLDGLTITPPADSDADFELTVTATSTEANGDIASTTSTLDVTVTGAADAPTLSTDDASGLEDTPIALDLSSALTDTDGSETLSITITGVPTGASLSAGTANPDGSWTLDPGQLDGLTITPASNSAADFELTVTATATEADGDTASTSSTVNVSVTGVADAPTLSVADASGLEDAPITLDLSSALTDTDGSESLSITITGVPDGASLSAGTANPDGSWTLEPGQLDGLTITPPANSDADFDLTVTATATEADGDTASTTSTLNVTVTGVADAPALSVEDASGFEDAPIALDLSSALTDADGSESLSITITGVPEGASLSAGTANPDGSWTLDPGQLDGLTITPPANSDADFDLTVTATSIEADGDSASTTSTINVAVTGVADAPVLTTTDASGLEDAPIALDIAAALTDIDGSESLTAITITGVPDGASLSAGTANPDGSWTLQPDQLDGLTITPASNSAADFELTVTATSTEADGDVAATTSTLNVTVTGVADAPTLEATDASGLEDAPIALDLSSALTDADGSETLSIAITGVPEGASLSAGTANPDGSWTLEPGQLDGLTITPPANSDANFDLIVTATSTEADGDSASTTSTINVTVTGVADAPVLTTTDASGLEDAPIALDIAAALTDIDGSESLTAITITGVPEGASLSAGTANPDGSWTLEPGQLDGLTVTPPANSDADFDLTVTATSTEADGDTASTSSTVIVSVTGVADAPTLSVEDASGLEDAPIALDLSSALTDTDGSESLSITITGVPEGASLSAGTANPDGSWTLEPGQLDGLTITPPANSDADFDLTVTATSTEADGDTASTSSTVNVSVTGVADAPTLEATDASGLEDAPIALDLSSALTDTDGSESLSITITGVPDGASLSAGTANPDGSWTLEPGQLDGLTITPPANSDADFDLTVTATSTEADGDSASTTSTINVTVTGVADAPVLTTTDASGLEDAPIALDIAAALTDIDGSESLTAITITGVPEGASLSAGTANPDGSWILEPGQLDGLTITPPANSDADFDLTVTATSTEADGDVASTTSVINVEVTGVADAPTVTTAPAEGFAGLPIALDLSAALTDIDGSESLSITITGVPEGASLSAGTANPDNSWTLEPGQLDGLTITPAGNAAGDFELTMTATSTEADGDSASTSSTFDLVVNSADQPSATGVPSVPSPEADTPAPDVPGEINWEGDPELGVINTVSDVDRTLEEIDTQLHMLGDGSPGITPAEGPGVSMIGEITPIIPEPSDSDTPLPPPDRPLYEFVREENADLADADPARAASAAATKLDAIEQDGFNGQQERSLQDRFTRTFTVLLGLVRSLGGRTTSSDEQDNNTHPRGRRG